MQQIWQNPHKIRFSIRPMSTKVLFFQNMHSKKIGTVAEQAERRRKQKSRRRKKMDGVQ